MKLLSKNMVIIGLIFVFASCKNKSTNDQIKVINDAFLAVADTIAYYALSVISSPLPDFFEKKRIVKYENRYEHFGIVVPDTLYPPVGARGLAFKLAQASACAGNNKRSYNLFMRQNY